MLNDTVASSDYVPIRLSSLEGDIPTTFDTYVKIGTRFLLYCRNGLIFGKDRLERLKKKNIQSLYILPVEWMQYHLYLQRNVEQAYATNESTEIRAKKIFRFNCELAESLLRNLKDPEIYEETKLSCVKFVEFVCSEEQALNALLLAPTDEQSIVQHSVRVAALATGLAQELHLVDGNRPIHLLALGCYIHDLEHFHSHFDCRRPLLSLSKEEMEDYRQHPLQAAEKLQGLQFIESLVWQIVLQHEENADGTGFPKGIKERDMDPMIMIVAVANSFDRLITFEGKSNKEALKGLLIDKMGAYPLDHLQALQSLLKKRHIVAA
jgi:HD-GYP domain-containing protein (c-di-GMP phosphodiesterase class II)